MVRKILILGFLFLGSVLEAKKAYDIRPFELRLKASPDTIYKGVRVIRFSLDTQEQYSVSLKNKAKKMQLPTELYMPHIEHIDYYVFPELTEKINHQMISIDGLNITWTKQDKRYVTNVRIRNQKSFNDLIIAQGSIQGVDQGIRQFSVGDSFFSSWGTLEIQSFENIIKKVADVRESLKGSNGAIHPYFQEKNLVSWHPGTGKIDYTMSVFFDEQVFAQREKGDVAEYFSDGVSYWLGCTKLPSKCNGQDNGPDGIYLMRVANSGMIWGETKNKNGKNVYNFEDKTKKTKTIPSPDALMKQDIWGQSKNGEIQFIVKYRGMRTATVAGVQKTFSQVRDYIVKNKPFAFVEWLVLPSGKTRRYVCNIDTPENKEWSREALKTAITLYENPVTPPLSPAPSVSEDQLDTVREFFIKTFPNHLQSADGKKAILKHFLAVLSLEKVDAFKVVSDHYESGDSNTSLSTSTSSENFNFSLNSEEISEVVDSNEQSTATTSSVPVPQLSQRLVLKIRPLRQVNGLHKT